jgi:hypothetical protein
MHGSPFRRMPDSSNPGVRGTGRAESGARPVYRCEPLDQSAGPPEPATS